MQVLHNLVQAYRLLADAPAAPVSAGMSLLNAYRDDSAGQVILNCIEQITVTVVATYGQIMFAKAVIPSVLCASHSAVMTCRKRAKLMHIPLAST